MTAQACVLCAGMDVDHWAWPELVKAVAPGPARPRGWALSSV